VFIFMMHSGFAMVEVGSVREKNAHNILIKNLYVVCAGVVAFWLIGYGFAFGQTGEKGGFIGTHGGLFAASNFDHEASDHFLAWIFQFAFAGTAATIVSGSLAERCHLPTFLFFSALMTGFIYPVVVSWTWGGGWLSKQGFFDFAGSGVVHLVGGSSGLIGAYIIGPRHGKEKNAA
jgi:Amt family ammonium transporter